MIKYNSNTINDWYRSSSAITKMMFNGSQAYMRVTRTLPQRWVVDSSSYLCVGTDKYEKEVKQYSLDDGITWQNYVPEISRAGELIFSGSVNCGGQPQERWVVDSSSYICVGYDKYAKEVKQYALDDYGIEWANYVPEVSRQGSLIKQNARQCGYTADTQEPCYAVVDTIVGYSDTEFVDVFDLSANKWYKLNNLNQFEEYGIYGNGRNITYYDGKLTVDDGYEYIYSGSSWVNVGEVSGSSQPIYPLYYDEIQDPPSALTFSTMEEAEDYECPYVSVTATISGTDYIFDENYHWVTKYQWVTVPNDYVCVSGDKYSKLEKQQRNIDDTWTSLGIYSTGTLIESASTDCSYACSVNLCGTDLNGDDISYTSGNGNLDNVPANIVEGIVGTLTTSLNEYIFSEKRYLTALTISDTVTTINHECFQDTTGLTTLTIPSSVTEIGFWTFARMGNCQEIIFENTSVYSLADDDWSMTAVFHDWYPPVIYVPDESVSAYRAKGITWYIDGVSTYPNIDDWIQPISNR